MTCSWPSCRRAEGEDVLVRDGDDADWLCLEHVGDDWLPEVVGGAVGACASCGKICVTWLVGDDGSEVALHDRCRRARAMSLITPERERGAWARRRAAS